MAAAKAQHAVNQLLQEAVASFLSARRSGGPEEWLHRLSHRSRSPFGKLLIGLLTCALPLGTIELKQPSQVNPVAISLKLFALTVAGQWRIFTALPIHQE
jgi:hypothetical protein